MNNSVFGKTQENLREHVQVELITDARILRKRVAKPNFCRSNPITDCLTAIQCTVATLTLNRPIYGGFSVLEGRCTCAHGQLRLLSTDTDSLAYPVQTEDIYRYMAEDAAIQYDFSEYPLDHPLYSAMNHKALGFFKDEINSVHMKQFVGLRPKCCASPFIGKVSNNLFQHTNTVEKKKATGVKRNLHTIWTHSKTFIHISVDRT